MTFKTPKLFRRGSKDESGLMKTPRSVKLGIAGGGEESSNGSFFASPSALLRSKFGQASGQFGTLRNTSDCPIACEKACMKFIGEPQTLSLLRPYAPYKIKIFAQVAKKLKSAKKAKSQEKTVDINNGVVTVLGNEQATLKLDKSNRRGPSVRADRDIFFLANVCGLKLSDKMMHIQVFCGENGRDDEGHRVGQHLVTFVLKFTSEEQCTEIGRNLLKEIECLGIATDLLLGMYENQNKFEKLESHLGCLLRKRVDLFMISKPPGSASLDFALKGLADYLQETGKEKEMNAWVKIREEIAAATNEKDKSGLRELQKELQEEQNQNGYQEIKYKLDMLFKTCEFSMEEPTPISTSFYGNLFRQEQLEKID